MILRPPRPEIERLGHEGRLVVDEEGRTVAGATAGWLCPSSDENIELLGEAARELAERFGPEGLHLDYVRLPFERSCLCGTCREAVKPGGDWPREVLPGGPRAREFRRFRRERVTAVVESIVEAARGARRGIYVSAAVFPELAMCRETLGQDGGDWRARGLVDFILPMDYTDSADELAGWVRDQARRVKGRVPLVPGIGLAAGRVGIEDPAELVRQIAVARFSGADGYAIFQLDGEFLGRHIGLVAAGPGRTGAGVRPHGGPALAWELPQGVDPGAIPAGRAIEIRLRAGLRTHRGLAVRGFEVDTGTGGTSKIGPRVELESASGRLLADLGPGPVPGAEVRLPVVVPAGPFRIAVRGRADIEGRAPRLVAVRSPLFTGTTDSEREAELARSRPVGPGPRVAVLSGGYGSRGVLAGLRREGSFAAYPVASLEDLGGLPSTSRGAAGARPDVLVLTQRRDPAELDGAARAALRLYVEAGGGVLLTHDAVGYRFHPVIFRELVEGGSAHAKSSSVKAVAGTALAEMIGPAVIEHAHFDHVVLIPGERAEVVAEGRKGPAVVWGEVGEGRVAACGIALGLDRDEREHAPRGREAELLLALVRYLATETGGAGGPGGQ